MKKYETKVTPAKIQNFNHVLDLESAMYLPK